MLNSSVVHCIMKRRPIVQRVQYWEVQNILGISKNGDTLNNVLLYVLYVRGDLRTTIIVIFFSVQIRRHPVTDSE